MAIEGVDYAWSRPDPAGLYAAGKRFASRYLSYDRTGKNLTFDEAERLNAAGLAVVCNWEWRAGDARGGYDAGRTYAQEAVRQAAVCGMPTGRPIYFSVDYDPAGAYGVIDAYFNGIASVLPVAQIGAYGGYYTIDHLLNAGLIRWAWQTFAWSGGLWHPGAHVQQYRNGVVVAGGDVDLDRGMVADFGQWTIGGEVDMADYGSLGPPPNEPEYAYAHPDVMLADIHAALVSRRTGWGGEGSASPWALFQDLTTLNNKLDLILSALTSGVAVPAKVDLTDEAIAAVADQTANEMAADPQRDGGES
jgi:hypothetical protein